MATSDEVQGTMAIDGYGQTPNLPATIQNPGASPLETSVAALIGPLLDCSTYVSPAGYCDRITIRLYDDRSCSVRHHDHWITVARPQAGGPPDLELGKPLDVQIGLPMASVQWMTITTGPRGARQTVRYTGGVQAGRVNRDDAPEDGLLLWFKPDPEILRIGAVTFYEIADMISSRVPRSGRLLVVLEDSLGRNTFLHGRDMSLVL